MSPKKKKTPRSKPTHVHRRHTAPVEPVVPAPVVATADHLDELLEIARSLPTDKIGRIITCARRIASARGIADDESAMPPLDPIRPNVAYSIPITVDGAAIGDLMVAPDADDNLVRTALDRLGSPASSTSATIARDPAERAWLDLGARLAELGPHRLTIGAHAARAAACGGVSVSPEEEAALCSWFAALVDELILRGGVVEDDNEFGPTYPGADAAWFLLCEERVRSLENPQETTRCSAPNQEGCAPGEAGFLPHLRQAAPRYLQTVIAGATENEIEELRQLVNASDANLEIYRPFGHSFAPNESPSSEQFERAIRRLTLRRPTAYDLCQSVEAWAFGSEIATRAVTIPEVSKIGALAWLASALRQAQAGGAS